MLDTNVIQSAVDKKYTEFSDAVRAELKNKLSNAPASKKYSDDFDKIRQMKDLFAKINNSGE